MTMSLGQKPISHREIKYILILGRSNASRTNGFRPKGAELENWRKINLTTWI